MEKPKQTVTIDKEEYKTLLKKSLTMAYLANSGVDNWEWYGESFDDEYYEEIEKIDNM